MNDERRDLHRTEYADRVRGIDPPLHDHFADFVRNEHVVAECDFKLARIRLPLETGAQEFDCGINARAHVLRFVRRKEIGPWSGLADAR